MKKLLSILVLSFISGSLYAGQWVAEDILIDSVSSTAANQDIFEITFTDSTSNSLCSSGNSGFDIVAFPVSAAGSPNIHERSFSVAMTALTMGLKVNIYSYSTSGVCWEASYIEIVR